MAEPTTWTELKANVADWLNRDDLTTPIPEFIGYAERRFNRVLRMPEMEESVTATTSDAVVTLPSNFLELKALYVDGDGLTPLRQMGIDQLKDTYRGEETGPPRFFALQSGAELVLAPAPTASTVYVMNYYEKIPALGSGQASNWLLASHPDLYVAGALVEAYLYLRDAAGAALWEARVRETLAALNDLAGRKAWGEQRARLRADTPVVPFNIYTG